MNGALRQSKSKRSNYTKVGKCRLSVGRHLPRSYPGMDSSTGEGLSRVTPWHSSCRVEISLTIHQNWFCKWDCPWMLRDDIWSVLYFFDNILVVYIRLRQQSLFPPFFCLCSQFTTVTQPHSTCDGEWTLWRLHTSFLFCLQVSSTCVVAHANFPIAMGTVETVEGRLPIFSLPPSHCKTDFCDSQTYFGDFKLYSTKVTTDFFLQFFPKCFYSHSFFPLGNVILNI